MHTGKLIQILKTFSPDEVKNFEKFVAYPYFSTGRNVEGLYSILKSYYPEFDSPKLDKKNVFKKLFPGEKFSEMKLKNVTTALTNLAGRFLAYERFDSDQFNANYFTAFQFKIRGNEKLLSNSLKLLEKGLEKLPFDSVDLFSKQERTARLKEEYHYMVSDFPNVFKERDRYAGYFTLSFLIASLRREREKVQIKEAYNIPLENTLFDSVIDFLDFEKLIGDLKKKKYSMVWMLELYYYCFCFTRDLNDKNSFEKFKKIFYPNIDKFSRREKYFFFNDIIDFSVRNEHRGNNSYISEEMKVYKVMMEQDSFTVSKSEYISIILYRNVMLLSLMLREYDWLVQFMKKYSGKLKPEYRESMKHFTKASINFEQGNFELALEDLSKITYDVFFYKSDIKGLLLKTFYELDLYEQAFSFINTFRQYLKTGKLGSSNTIMFQNFLSFYTKLLKAKTGNKTTSVGKLIDQLNEKKSIYSGNWLMEKLKELNK